MKARLAFLLVVALALSCGKTPPAQVAVPNERPSIELSTAPQPGDSVYYVEHFTWFSYDPDGQVVDFRYAVDPPLVGDTSWVSLADHELTLRFRSSTPGGSGPTGIAGTDYHVFAVEAVDNAGLASAVASVAFTSYTVAPTARLLYPSPSRLITASTPTSVLLQWTGIDPDGTGDKRPLKYKFTLVEQGVIQAYLGLGSIIPSPSDLQSYLSLGAPSFASWDSVGADTTSKQFNALTPGTTYYFAIIAFDDAGAYDPRFDLDRNVLRLRPQTELLGPRLTVSNDLVSASSSSIDLSPSRIAHVTIPSGEQVRFNWKATAATGGIVVGYRWVLDPLNGDLTDETPRDNDNQTYRWSAWAAAEQSAVAGPYDGSAPHFFYVEARDNSGAMSLVQIEIDVVQKTSAFLVIDDFQGPPDFDYGPSSPYSFQPYGNFPTEAVLDTLMYAVGGKPYQHRPPGTLSQPGMFAGFDYDTLDYRFRTSPGIPLSLLFRYQALVIYTGTRDATTSGSMLDALRYAAWRQTPNPLVSYVAHGGKVWFFGDGVIYAFLLRPGDQVYSLPRIAAPGQYPYDYWKLRSTFGIGGGGTSPPDYMIGATPYLPGYATPGRPWPPDENRKYTRFCDDPRVGPAASRNIARWSGLPCLHLTTEFNNWPSGFPGGVKSVLYVGLPNSILETLDPKTNRVGSALDTLYLWRAVNYIGSSALANPDGKPVMCAYEGIDSGPVVWSGMPLWFYDRTELRQLAAKVLSTFGIMPSAADPTTFRGPGSAQHLDDRPTSGGSPIASERSSE
jgi:hypothetical protein